MSSIDEVLLGFGGVGGGGGGGGGRGRMQASSGAGMPMGRREYGFAPRMGGPPFLAPSLPPSAPFGQSVAVQAKLEVTAVRVPQEEVSRGGAVRNVYVAVKSAPIPISVRLLLPASELEENMKKVDFVKVRPVDWKVRTVAMHSATLDVKIKTLTSHHEDMFFRVAIAGVDSRTANHLTPPLVAFSPPIKVISKQEPGNRKSSSKKKQVNDALVGLVTRIDAQAQANNNILRQYIAAGGVPPTPPADSQGAAANPSDPWSTLEQQFASGVPAGGVGGGDSGGSGSGGTGAGGQEDSSVAGTGAAAGSSTGTPTEHTWMGGAAVGGDGGAGSGGVDRGGRRRTAAPPSFERAFSNFVDAFSALSVAERPAMIRSVTSGSARQSDSLSCLVDVLAEEKSAGARESTSLCACKVCPCQKELEQIDAFYSDMTANQEAGGHAE